MAEPKRTNLPQHIIDILYGTKNTRKLSRHHTNASGILVADELNSALDTEAKPCPWLPDTGKRFQEMLFDKKSKGNIFRQKKQREDVEEKEETNKYVKYDKMIQQNAYNKIAFLGSEQIRDLLPPWCQDRLRTACRSARFELPLEKKILETISPLQFLAKYTRLYREQRRRYSRIFMKHKSKTNDYIEFQNLFPAINSMFGTFLSENNFKILCTALFIDKHTLLDEATFIGVCTFADRLFWTSYLEYLDRDTFSFLGPNRSVLEYADFENLKRKLDGLNLSKEIYHLLYSLA